MAKVCLMFPGQGSQSVGMGRDIFENNNAAWDILKQAGDGIKEIIFDGPEDALKLTKWAQPAIFTASSAFFAALKSQIDMSKHSFVGAGHSLGEYSALCAAGFFDFEQGLEIVRARGSFLQTASEKNPGAMAAVLGLSKEKVLELCSKASSKGVCEAVNFNCPGQIVVSGAVAAIENFMDLAREAGAAKCVKLNVSGAFHSSLMKEAAVEMQEKLTKYTFNKPSFGVYTNYDAELTVDPDQLKEKLIKQVDHPVLWDMTIEKIIAAGFEIFIEVGPGKVLSGLLRKVDRSKKAYNVSDQDSLQEVVKLLA